MCNSQPVAPGLSPDFFRIWLIVIAGFQAILVTSSALQHSAAIDEGGHILSGLLYWKTGKFTTYVVNPPLAKLWISLPVLSMDPIIPVDGKTKYQHDWQAAHDEFVRDNHEYYPETILLARLAIIPISSLGLILAAYWSRQLYGDGAGLLTATLWATNPMFLGWSAIANVDVLAATGMLAATHVIRRWVIEQSWPVTIAAGLAIGLAQLLKFSLLVLYPSGVMLILLRRRAESWRLTAFKLATLFIVSIAVINAGYGFHSTGSRLGGLPVNSHLLTTLQRIVPWGRFPLPDTYVIGIDEQKSHSDAGYPAYFRGQEYRRGFWYYYLYCALIKEPLPMQICLALSIWKLACRKTAFSVDREGVLLAPSLLLLVALSHESGMHLHYRYFLPAMPLLLVFLGSASSASASPLYRSLLGVLIGWSFITALASHPHHVSYFNPLVGGPQNGHHHLADTNVDCGQDLLFLKDWLAERNSGGKIALAYTGPVSPSMYGITSCSAGRELGILDDCSSCEESSDVIVVSANLLAGRTSYSPDAGRMERLPSAVVRELARRRPLARIGGSLLAYQMNHPLTESSEATMSQPVPRRKLGLVPTEATRAPSNANANEIPRKSW